MDQRGKCGHRSSSAPISKAVVMGPYEVRFIMDWKMSEEFNPLLYSSPFSPSCPVQFRITAEGAEEISIVVSWQELTWCKRSSRVFIHFLMEAWMRSLPTHKISRDNEPRTLPRYLNTMPDPAAPLSCWVVYYSRCACSAGTDSMQQTLLQGGSALCFRLTLNPSGLCLL